MSMITKDMKIQEIISKYPYTVEVFFRHGLMCIGCVVAQFESLEEGAIAHGINTNTLLKDLNQAVREQEALKKEEEKTKEKQ